MPPPEAPGNTGERPQNIVPAVLLAGVVCALSIPALAAEVRNQVQDGPQVARDHPPPPVKVASVEGITEYQLANGLRVLLCPDPSRTTFTVNVTYLVGSRHEVRGEHGMAHLLEHMLTRSTTTYDSIMTALEDRGADQNADTWFDRTHFYETLSAGNENLEFVLHLEAERMVQVKLRAEDLAQEMAIISNEFELVESDPKRVLSARMRSAAYAWHGYGKPTIGTLSDIKRYPTDNLRRFYEKYYQPDNAVLLVAGKFDVDRVLGLIIKHFGAIPRPSRTLAGTYTEEPTQHGPLSVTVEGAGDITLAGLMYHVPSGSHMETPALQILQDVLVSEPSGRLYRALVETGMAARVSIDDDAPPSTEPGVLGVVAEIRREQDPLSVRSRMIEVVEALAAKGITDVEVERAKGRRLKQIRRTLADTKQLANELTEWIALGDWRLFFIHRDRLHAVTADDVERVARKYLVGSNRTTGLFSPTKDPLLATMPSTPDVPELVKDYQGREALEAGEAFIATAENIDRCTLRLRLDPGMEIATLQKPTRGGLAFARLRFHFGNEQSLSGHTEALRLLPALLRRGTTNRDYQQLRDEIDRLQSEITIGGGVGTFGVSIESDREHIAGAIALAAAMLQRPAFDPIQFEIIKKERLAEIEQGLSSPQERCFNALRRAVYPWSADSIHYVPTLEERIERVGAVTLEEVKDLHRRFYGGSHVEVSLVGSFDQGKVLSTLGEHFGSWESRSSYERIAMPHRPVDSRPHTISTPGKPMAVVAVGTHLEMRDDHPDYPALRFASYILAESTKSRLYDRLRFRDTLSYHVGGALRADSQDRRTSLFAYAFCSPDKADTVLAALREEIDLWINESVGAEELAESKRSYAEEFRNRLADDSFVAGQLVDDLELNRCLAFQASMLAKIESMTAAEIKTALKKHLHSLRFVEIKAGDIE
ncbi:MAG: M16 family metallopeptidase [Planctomycetota bacterium]|jgi:zinc protease